MPSPAVGIGSPNDTRIVTGWIHGLPFRIASRRPFDGDRDDRRLGLQAP